MIVILGASSDVGQRLSQRLIALGLPVRRVARSPGADVYADLSSGEGLRASLEGATTVISTVHARFAGRILEFLPDATERLILLGSAWRYSNVPNERADQVKEAERLFATSGRSGVMLHPTMIYGGNQENNVQRLIAVIRKLPFIPAPGGGTHIVQPIYVDDVVSCLASAVQKNWSGPTVIPICGPPLMWRDMATLCAAAIGLKRSIVSVPLSPVLFGLVVLNSLGVAKIDPDILRRFREDVSIPLDQMQKCLSATPRDFSVGIAAAVAGWKSQNALA
ncbi:hypothetical protein BH10PSE11_BH10PSE11_08400 [soil metagenome]